MPEEGKRAAALATFADVTPGQRRAPSWIVRQRPRDSKEGDPPPRPPRLPREFVAAFQREMEHHSRAPEPPPAEPSQIETRAPTEPPPPAAPPAVPEPPAPDPALVAALAGAIEQVSRARAEVLTVTAGQLAELAAMIARRVLSRELSVEPAVIHGLVREGLDALGEHDHVVVRLGTGFSSMLDEVRSRLEHVGTRAEVRVSAELGDYGCVVETELGSVDESIETRLATLLQALKPESAPPG
ncbi:MAG: FliH/SctL family protein [Polyangiaceae bacterium]